MNSKKDNTYFHEESYIGKCIFSIPKLGYIVQFLRSGYGIMGVAGLILLLIIADRTLDSCEPHR